MDTDDTRNLKAAYEAAFRLNLDLEAENAKMRLERVDLRKALADCVDALEYVERSHQNLVGITGGAVRVERIQQARRLLQWTSPPGTGEGKRS